MTEDTNYLDTQQAGRFLGLSAKTLARYRVSGEGPVFHRFGNRIRYRRDDLDAWADARRRVSTVDDGTALEGADRCRDRQRERVGAHGLDPDLVGAGLHGLLDFGGDPLFQFGEELVLLVDRQRQQPVEDARPQHVRRRAHMLREVDVEAGDRGLQLGTCLWLEGELPLYRPRDAGGEQRVLLGLGERTHGREGLAVVLDRQPVEAEPRAVLQHGFARAPGGEVFVVHAHSRPVGGLAHRDVECMRLVTVGEDGAAELEQHEVEGGLEVPGELRLHQRRPDRPQIVGKADADTAFLARFGLAVLRQVHGPGHRRAGDAAGIGPSAVSTCPAKATIVPGATRTGLSWMVTAGVAAALGESVALDLAWRYTDLGAVHTVRGEGQVIRWDRTRDPLLLDMAPTRARLASHGLRLSLRYGSEEGWRMPGRSGITRMEQSGRQR